MGIAIPLSLLSLLVNLSRMPLRPERTSLTPTSQPRTSPRGPPSSTFKRKTPLFLAGHPRQLLAQLNTLRPHYPYHFSLLTPTVMLRSTQLTRPVHNTNQPTLELHSSLEAEKPSPRSPRCISFSSKSNQLTVISHPLSLQTLVIRIDCSLSIPSTNNLLSLHLLLPLVIPTSLAPLEDSRVVIPIRKPAAGKTQVRGIHFKSRPPTLPFIRTLRIRLLKFPSFVKVF